MVTMSAAMQALVVLSVGTPCLRAMAAPTVTTGNGTYGGLSLPSWDQEAFLGMPYAQAPVGRLRYRWPQGINKSFEGVRDASRYGPSCMQYGSSLELSEDCLTINVVRPAGVGPESSLPVLVWIHGGGLFAGSSADAHYNLSGVVAVSQRMGRPLLAVSINYRLDMWGFLQSPQILAEGSANAGLLDQRLALHWIQENVAAFGGDRSKATVWGESAGAQSIAYQLFAYGGRDDGLFRAAILESGGPLGAPVLTLPWYKSAVDNLTRATGCGDAADQLDCLRGLDTASLFSTKLTSRWNPIVDADFLTAYPSQLAGKGQYLKVPIITGTNTDESFSVSADSTVVKARMDSDDDIRLALASWRSYSITPPTARRLLELYPDDPCHAPPYAITNCTRNPSSGLQWRRAAAIGSDLVMHAGRRRMAELYAPTGSYSYRFDQRPWNGSEWGGVQHFQNVAYSFQNISGQLGPSPEFDSHLQLARAIGAAYVNFVHHLDPNDNSTTSGLPQWPRYDLLSPRSMVFNATRNWVEADTWRREGIAFINSPDVSKELLG